MASYYTNNTSQQQHGYVTSYGQGNMDEAALPVAIEILQRQVNDDPNNELQSHREYMAYAIPPEGTSAVANDSRHVVKVAQLRGKIANEEEREAIEKANREAHSKRYFVKHAIKEANQRAKLRDAQGLQVESCERPVTTGHGESHSTEHQTLTRESMPNQEVTADVHGYAVKGYQMTSDYETTEYKVQEYKSLYD